VKEGMRYTLADNWSIFSGFLLASIALAGMSYAVFTPMSISLKLPPKQGVGALPAPLKPFRPEAAMVEGWTEVEEKPEYPGIQSAEAVKVSSSKVLSKPNLEEDPVKVNTSSPQPETLAAIPLAPEVPVRIMIPSIGLDAPIVIAEIEFEKIDGKEYLQWFVPDEYASGWHSTSAMLGEPGNTVLNGHHNASGEVFKSLVDVTEGDIIQINSEGSQFRYQITNKMILPEKYEQLDVRMNNAHWLLPSIDERLTLITCWPYDTNTHRLIIVARPLARYEITSEIQ